MSIIQLMKVPFYVLLFSLSEKEENGAPSLHFVLPVLPFRLLKKGEIQRRKTTLMCYFFDSSTGYIIFSTRQEKCLLTVALELFGTLTVTEKSNNLFLFPIHRVPRTTEYYSVVLDRVLTRKVPDLRVLGSGNLNRPGSRAKGL